MPCGIPPSGPCRLGYRAVRDHPDELSYRVAAARRVAVLGAAIVGLEVKHCMGATAAATAPPAAAAPPGAKAAPVAGIEMGIPAAAQTAGSSNAPAAPAGASGALPTQPNLNIGRQSTPPRPNERMVLS